VKLIDEILEQLQIIGSNPRRNCKGWVAMCPAHDDRQSSLLIRQDSDGLPLLECSAGCSSESIINAVSASSATSSRPAPLEHTHRQENTPPKPQAGVMLSCGLNDLYHARKIVGLHGHEIRYSRELGGFLIWDDKRWTQDKYDNVWRMAIHTAWVTYLEERDAATSANERSRLHKWVTRAESRRNIEDALKHLQTRAEIIATPCRLDSNPWLLNVNNGTIDLRIGQLREHRPEDLITKIAPVTFDPACPPPDRWLQFLSEIFDGNHELIDFIQRACGYTLTGSVREQKMFFLHGPGANGKSTFLETLMFIMGDYLWRLPANLLLGHSRDTTSPAFADLRACRLAVTTETDSGQRLAEAAVKKLTGGDSLTVCHTRHDRFDFQPTHKVFMCGNHLPIIRGTDHAIWRRIKLIPFNVTIPEERQDKDLPQKLRAEASGILNWLITGCLEWQKGGLAEPPEIMTATRAYRNDMDVLGDFLNDCCFLAPNTQTTSADLNRAYKEWCEKNGERPMSVRWLGLRLKERGFKQERTMSARLWQGLRQKEMNS
jgi:putative DNA primase/helicase